VSRARAALVGVALALSLAPAFAGERTDGESGGERGAGWIGAIVPPYPDGTRETQGSCIGSVDAPGGVCGHALAVLDDAQSGLRTVLALRAAKHFGEGPLWQVVDAIEPGMLDDRSVAVAVATCEAGGQDDGHLLALVRPVEAEWLPALQAWRFDTAAGRLLELPAASVRCRNEGFGYDG
jgi:hypothetical protein